MTPYTHTAGGRSRKYPEKNLFIKQNYKSNKTEPKETPAVFLTQNLPINLLNTLTPFTEFVQQVCVFYSLPKRLINSAFR